MARRDPFARLKQPLSPTPQGGEQPPRPIDLIPRPKKRERRRDWERANRAQHYRVPHHYYARARRVREALLGLAQQYQTTADAVASALMQAALAAVREGEIQLDVQPNPHGQKMAIEVVRKGGWPQEELPKPKPKKKTPALILTYRWGQDTNSAISAIADKWNAPKGAVVVLLLEAALERVKAGKWGLRPRPVAVKQTVEVSNSQKNRR